MDNTLAYKKMFKKWMRYFVWAWQGWLECGDEWYYNEAVKGLQFAKARFKWVLETR